MAPKKTTALAVVDNFQIVKRYEGIDPELLEELQDEAEDLDPGTGIDCRKIKMPSGGSLAFEVQGEDDEAEYMKEISGVIVFIHRLNGYWSAPYGANDDPQDKIPVCSSIDGKIGIKTDTGETMECDACPYNQFGTAVDQKGQPARGKACKNMRRVYIMMNGDPNLYLLTVPPTSMINFGKQIKMIMSKNNMYIPCHEQVVKFSLEKAQNAAGIAYSKIVVKRDSLLSDADKEKTKAVRREIEKQYKGVAVTSDDYQTAPPAEKVEAPAPPTESTEGTENNAAKQQEPDYREAPPNDDGDNSPF